MQRVGFTSTVPLEIVLAAGRQPVDLNNLFITSPRSHQLVEDAELAGFPRTVCDWIKGLYAVALESGIHEIIAVTEGDCSYTKALMEVLSLHGVKTVPFAYPPDRNPASLRHELEKLMNRYGVDWPAVEAVRQRLQPLRAKVAEIDRLTWEEDRVSGGENHLFQVCCSDMEGDPERYAAKIDAFVLEAAARPRRQKELRLAYLGVPPIIEDLYPFLESRGARVVFNETQRQFAMPGEHPDMVSQYLAYTYPYDIFHRLADLLPELARRRVDGVIHYVQSFCFRQIEDLIIRNKIPLPLLTLEGDKPARLDARTRLRLEGFLEMLADRNH